ncbi:ParB/RepB/Spo0J family partition protein [Laspinema olomoucense]|uniref:ParB/RepB/Spo0J family partition protein n=1 Tax=Laspinema olomoucense TaxID=3231600 RepID=UPI0021BB8F38|nr:ParB/RepB/Spo0J family partition protein [Laspinema sp. D3a]MCT7989078.1 ParB/RepB/Spo0J family partition protein [Laspinema sp. D3a]
MTNKRSTYQLKGVDALFGLTPDSPDTDASQAEPVQVELGQIRVSEQPRRYFAPEKEEDLIQSIKQYGILQPILVRPQGEGLYELVAGERRYRAAIAAGLKQVPVLVRFLSDVEVLEVALLENLQREDLNPIEETEGILRLLELRLTEPQTTIMKWFNQAAHPERESVDNVIHREKWQQLVGIFEALGKFTPESFRTNRLPLLKMPEDVKAVLRQGQLEYTKARAIATVKQADVRSELLDEAISQGLSLSQIKEKIAAYRLQNHSAKTRSLKQEFDAAYSEVKKSEVWKDPTKQKKLRKLLKDLQALVEEESPA